METTTETTPVRLNEKRVKELFRYCLFNPDEDMTKYVEAEGIRVKVGFHPERLKEIAAEVESLLNELPDEFKAKTGGGASFINACYDRHGNQWADLQQSMDELLMLGQAIGRVICVMPRSMWGMLPGGMPYYVIQERVEG